MSHNYFRSRLDEQQPLQPWRMISWLFFGLLFYAASIFTGTDYPQIQAALWKAGHVTMFGFIGYWIARRALGRVFDHSPVTLILARAILIGLVIVAGSVGG